ncbi:MAG: ABC transporter permease, partial [Thermoplasmata archaeon]|nr:ABC transporter permease [Thermoplasmata archaeon]
IAGVALSRLLLGVVNPSSGPALSYDAFILTPNTLLVVVILSLALMGAVTYRSAKRTASLPIIETLRYYAPGETKLLYNPRTDIILVSIGIGDYVLVWARAGSPTDLMSFLLGFIPFLLLPFVPLLLIVGFTRLLTRGTGKVYDWFSRAAKPFTKDLYYIIRRNLMRNPRRSANVAIIIALGLAFGVFSLSILATNAAHMEREIRAGIGADMAVYPRTVKSDLAANLSVIPGVVGISKVRTVNTAANYGVTVYALDPDSYFAVAQPEGWYFADDNPQHGHEVLNHPGQILISQAYANSAAAEIGDRVTLSQVAYYPTNNTYETTILVNVTVGGIVQFLPGLPGTPYCGGLTCYPYNSGGNRIFYGSNVTLQPFLDGAKGHDFTTNLWYLADLAANANWRTVKSAAVSDSNVGFVAIEAESLELQTTNPFARAVYGFIGMEIAFIVVILTFGVGLILFAASLERDVEFAAIIARGSSGWQTAKLLVGEAFVIMLVGLTIGVGVGLGTAFFATHWLATGPGGAPTSAVPFFFIFPWDAVFLVLLGPAAILLAAFLVSARVAHINVAQVLKLRGG